MEYGIRLKAHDYPIKDRTSLPLGDEWYGFSDEFVLKFDLSFYDDISFGQICTIYGNNGTKISLVSTRIDDNSFRAALIINDELHTLPMPFDASSTNPLKPLILLNRDKNEVTFKCGNYRYSFPCNMKSMNKVKVVFGRTKEQSSVAPADIREINVYTDKKYIRRWELSTHKGDSVVDNISQTLALAENPYWILDDHVYWKRIFSTKSPERLQTAFDVKKGIFYVVGSSEIISFNAAEGTTKELSVALDGRVMRHSNFLTFDSVTGCLLSYNLKKESVATFDFATRKWSSEEACLDEPHFANHGFATDGKYAYTFGGYGFYKYNNDFFRIDLASEKVEKINLTPAPDPRTSASLCVVDNKLYLFGGIGNAFGKQEMPSKSYYDLWEYDLSTNKGRRVWEIDSICNNFFPSLSMYYVPSDSCFYAASTMDNGLMIRIMRNYPKIEIVSKPIRDPLDYRDCMFNLFRSADQQTYYLVIDKSDNDHSHDYAIYSICYPFGNLQAADAQLPQKGEGSRMIWYIISGFVFIGLICVIAVMVVRKRKNHRISITASSIEKESKKKDDNKLEETATPEPEASDYSENMTENQTEENNTIFDSKNIEHLSSRFDFSKSSISLLGRFEIRDGFGADITPKFSSRIRDILLMLILYSEKYEKGLNYKTLDDLIWPEKDEKSAKNNRNVYMRKLRLLLEEVGDLSISCVKGNYRISEQGGKIDYHELMSRLKDFDVEKNSSPEEYEDIIELLLRGPLLTNLREPWFDDFKSEFTDSALRILNTLLMRVYDSKNYNLAHRIADIVSRHDPLSEEALMVKCRILYAEKMNGPAKNAYDTFCREYQRSFGEDYNVSFAKIVGHEKE